MTALAVVSEAEDWWVAVLRAAIRDEFAVDRYFARPGELLFGADVCAVTDCAYPAYRAALGLCAAHAKQFTKSDLGEVAAWVARSEQDGGPIRKRNRRVIVNCAVVGCARSAEGSGVCAGHHQRWRRTRPRGVTYESFLQTTPATFSESYGAQTPPSGSCGVVSCAFPRRPKSELCDHHHAQFRNRQLSRRADYTLADFEMWIEQPGAPVYNVAGFGSPLREELQFALQCRSDERRATIAPHAFPAVRRLMLGSSRSLLELDPNDPVFRVRYAGRFLTYARGRVEGLRDSATNVSEWERDVWRIERLPGVQARGCTAKLLSFEFCDPAWLREVIKRWMRWRLSTGTAADTSATDLRSLRALVTFADRRGAPLTSPQAITRELLEDFLAHVATIRRTVVSRNRTLGVIRVFLADCRRHDWVPGLDPRATYYRDDYTRRPEQLPRFLSEHVMGQIENEENLAKLPSLTARTVVKILIGTGLRAGDALSLTIDALSEDSAGAPYLRYFNHKLGRERYIPVSDALAEQIRRQQAHVRGRFESCPHLLPRGRCNPDGSQAFSYATLISQLRRWAQVCDIREADGTRAHITAHRFRHTLATRMINNDVPEIAVQHMLDHNSPTMTRVYAKLHDSTLRDHYDRYQDRINIKGEVVTLTPDGSLSDADWAKQRLARAKLTLPNGYCGRPLQAQCPHPNACLTCPDFLTTVEHLPAHHNQLTKTHQLIDTARAHGHERLVEQNEQIRLNLTAIIAGLEALPQDAEVEQ
jgi:integrase